MSENEPIFKEYLDQDRSFSHFIKQPKSWLIIFSVVVGIILLGVFIKTVIMDTMTPQEVSKAIEVVWQDTVWLEKDVTPNEVKVVPSIRFKVKNVGPKSLEYVNFEGVFRIEETDKELGSGGALEFKDGLRPGEESGEILIKSNFGYSGSTKANIMKNKEWKQVRVTLYARTRGSGPAVIGDTYTVKKEIEGLTETPDAAGAAGAVGAQDAPAVGEMTELQKRSFEKIGKTLQIFDQDSVWVERSRVLTSKKVTIVPSITFRVKNVGVDPMEDVIFKGEFLFEDTGEKLSEGTAVGLKEALAPGDICRDITLQSDLGYEAASKAAFVRNPQDWRRVKVKIFAKQLDYEYVLLGIYPIRQEVEGIKVVYEHP